MASRSPVQIGSNDNAGPQLSTGLYKGWRTAEDREQDTAVTDRLMYFDEFRYGTGTTTYADVAPRGSAPLVCAQDLNGDGSVDGVGELENCLTSTDGAVCPIGATACRSDPASGRQICPLDPTLPCAEEGIGSGQSVCSVNRCIDRSTLPAPEPEVPSTPPEDNGPRDAAGNCLGQIEVFAGQAVRCRTGGTQTLYRNCCKNRQGVISDSMGSASGLVLGGRALTVIAGAAHAAVTGGVAAANTYLAAAFDPTSLALTVAVALIADLLADQCDEEDMTTALLSSSEYCAELGDYCAEDWPLVGCVQRAHRFCCFNSKLARIIQEQARPQLPVMEGFGTPEEPNCRGFTPEEFQAIDFSKIDLSEYYDDIRARSQALIEEDVRGRAQQSLPH